MIRKIILFTLSLFFITEINAQSTNWGVQFSDAIISRYQPNINTMTKKGWEYSNSIVLHGMEQIYAQTKNSAYLNYIKAYIDSYIGTDGTNVSGLMEQNLDVFHPGLLCLLLYEETGLQKYKTASALVRNYIDSYPRTASKGFWHKSNYPNQMWLDGIYMAEPFFAKYGFRMGDATYCNNEATFQVLLLYRHAFDPAKNLLYHGWDESKTASWANLTTGVSPEVWSRALGWYAMALVDILKYLPDDHAKRDSMLLVLNQVATGIKNYQDATTGLWYQVVDKGSTSGNWTETSGSGMFVYALKTAVNYGWIDTSYLAVARKGWTGLKTKIGTYTDGKPGINDFAAAMGIKNNFSLYVTPSLVVDCPVASGTQHPHGYCAVLLASSVMEYTLPRQFRLQTYSGANGTVTANTSELYQSEGAVITLTATPEQGFTFSHWSGDATGTNASIEVTMNADKHITANFVNNVTSAKAIKGTSQFNCYPSVTSNTFKASYFSPSSDLINISVSDLQGKKVTQLSNILSKQGKNEFQFDLTFCHSGLYICLLSCDDNIYIRKILKM